MSAQVLVVGAGIGGLTAALCLAREGIQVLLLEQADDFHQVGAGIQLSPNCSRILHYLGLEGALRARGFLPEGTQFRDYRSGRVISESVLGQAAMERYGAPYYHIHRGDLLTTLVEAVEASADIERRLSQQIVDLKLLPDRVDITSASGAEFTGRALIGADGIHSKVRTRLWGETAPDFTGNVAWRALVPAAQLPEGMVRPMSTAWWGPHKHFVHYYVRGGELVNCVCVVEKEGWSVESWTERGQYAELKSDFQGWHDEIQTLIDAADRESLYKWALFDRPPMTQWSKGRATLLGDACHPTLPFMAQGAAMAIEDGAVLAACLKAESEVPAALARYESLRLKRTAGVQSGSRRNAKVFHLTGVKAWARNRAARRASGHTMDRLFRYDALTPVVAQNPGS